MLKTSITSFVINVFILEVIPFIYVKSFSCPDYLSSDDRENMMRATKWFIRLLALGLSLIFGYFVLGSRDLKKFGIYALIGMFVFVLLSFYGIAVEKFIIFKTDSLKEKCKNFKPKFKL